MSQSPIAIVLTGSIIPNAPFTSHSDPKARRDEYLKAIDFYREFAPIYFLENSPYDLDSDGAFTSAPNLYCRRMNISLAPERGKGFQEFEMLDNWLETESKPPDRWIKITGRYIYRNFAEILGDCEARVNNHRPARFIIDSCIRSRKALSYLFYTETAFYSSRLKGIYLECDDHNGQWIEKVLYRHLAEAGDNEVRLFSVEPRLTGRSGTSGETLEAGEIKYRLKSALRKINMKFDSRYLRFTR